MQNRGQFGDIVAANGEIDLTFRGEFHKIGNIVKKAVKVSVALMFPMQRGRVIG